MCTASGRKTAQEGLNAQRRQSSRMVDRSKFVGGYAALSKTSGLGGLTKKTTTYDLGGDNAGDTGTRTTYRPAQRTWTGQSGRVYQVKSYTDYGYDDSEAGTGQYVAGRGSYVGMRSGPRVGREIVASSNTKDNPLKGMGFSQRIRHMANMSDADRAAHNTKYKNYNVGTAKGGIWVGSEEEARATYKDFGMDFDKDEYKGEFYKTERGLSTGQRINVQAQEGKRRKLNRIRGGAGAQSGGVTAGNARRKAKRQGSFRISSAGVQGGSTGGGTTLS